MPNDLPCGFRHSFLRARPITSLTPAPDYDEETRGYIDALKRLNCHLSEIADIVITMRDGTPVFVKGDAHALE